MVTACIKLCSCEMSFPQKKFRTDKCANPFNKNSHKGKILQRFSSLMLSAFPHLPPNAMTCNDCRRIFYGKTESLSTNSSMSLEGDEVNDNSDSTSRENKPLREEQLEELLQGLNEKFNSLPDSDPLRLNILTVAPEYWSIRKIALEFGTSYRMAKKAKDLRQSAGVLASPTAKAGKTLPAETVEKVKEFYEDDLNSRIMPHKKETVSVEIEGCKQKIQKRLLLSDIKDLHKEFKEKFPQHPVGLTKFAELRPK